MLAINEKFISSRATHLFIFSGETELSLEFTMWSKNALEFMGLCLGKEATYCSVARVVGFFLDTAIVSQESSSLKARY